MTTGREAATAQLPEEARQAIWRIFGHGLAPLKQRTWYELVAPVIRHRLGKTDEADRAINEIRGWFDPEAQSNQLRPDMNDAVAEMIIEGIGVALEETAGIGNQDTAFWAMGSIHPDIAAPLINNAWCTDQIDAFATYAVDTLESLHEKGDIRDPKRVFGEDVQGAKARPSQTGLHDPLRTFQVGPDTAFEAWRQMYSGIPQVVALLLELKPAMLPELVGRVEDPLLQSLAAFCASGLKIPSDHHQPLQWVTDTSPAALIAMAIVQVMAIVRETKFADRTAANIGTVDTTEAAPVSDMIGDMVDSLAALEPVGCTRWLFELLNHTSFGPNEKPAMAELVERHCTRSLEKIVIDHWSVELVNELEAGLRRATLDPRGKPLADIAWEIRDQQPERAGQICGILLREHERRMTEALSDNLRALYLSDHWNQRDWLISLGAAVVIKHTGLHPMDWAIEKCKALPLSAWDADEGITNLPSGRPNRTGSYDLDAADGQPPLFPQRGDQAEQVDAEALLTQDHAAQFRRRCAAPSARRASPSKVDVLGDLRGNHRQLDDLPSALDPAAGQVGAAIGTVLHHVLHPVGRCHARAGEAVASLLAGLLLRWGLPGRFRLEAGHSERAARFRLAFQFGNPPLQPLNHRL